MLTYVCSLQGVERIIMTLHFRQHGGSPTIYANSKAEERYLNLDQLGMVLDTLSQRLPGKE